MKLKLGVLGALLLAGANAMACYTVYDGNNRIVYRGTDAPVDMSLPLHEALRTRFPVGASMVFEQGASCAPVNLAEVARPTGGMVPPNTLRMERTGRQISPSSEAPLLTDRQTAERQGLPHTVVAGDIVMVPPSAAARAQLTPFTVVPTDTTALAQAGAPDTRTLGAGPAPRKQETVITEMRDPPMTIIQRGGNVTVNRY